MYRCLIKLVINLVQKIHTVVERDVVATLVYFKIELIALLIIILENLLTDPGTDPINLRPVRFADVEAILAAADDLRVEPFNVWPARVYEICHTEMLVLKYKVRL